MDALKYTAEPTLLCTREPSGSLFCWTKNKKEMKKNQYDKELSRRRFREKVDGPVIRKWYAVMPTAELAERMGLTVKQIENYVYNHNDEPWARKDPALLSAQNSVKGKKGGGRPRKNGK